MRRFFIDQSPFNRSAFHTPYLGTVRLAQNNDQPPYVPKPIVDPIQNGDTPYVPKPIVDPFPNGEPPINGEPPLKGGKTMLNLEEARSLLDSLNVVLSPLTAEEAEKAAIEEECLRELAAGPFPIVVRLRDRLEAFVKTAGPEDLFPISHGEVTVMNKAVDCAVAIGRKEVLQTVATAGAAGGAGILLLLLL